ncbi:2-deoxy-D-gluconate 3-dehydrogenase [Rhodosalinus halophilus]|uniref:2-deoxy-D-gluconate 3-dehydrogenase n=1 Tax=Rhodosalinus halophilus TaxID=2259333 RepID=A0A365UD89_9RHOB|nr:SDR family NAD(P)-dependent oxidoreductase [Rhodosalinus halophilus]RBI87471.1 2-deoxy-D-gluconate 3-dehydrogenase [Rhodosalinus halophilus]
MDIHPDLSGKTALVTGCRRGIGRAIAVALARSGADILGVSASVSEDDDVAREVRAEGRRFTALPCDLSDRAALTVLCDTLARDHPAVDILVNNAGTIRRAPAAEHADADWDAAIATNLTAPFVLTREIGRGMVARGAGKIVFVGSVLSFQGGILVPGYAASKAGVAQLARSFANEWAAHGVNVNAVAPGYVATDNTAALQADAERSRALLERVPAGRWGRPEDIAGPVLFLVSEAAGFVHGAVLAVDGGWLAR